MPSLNWLKHEAHRLGSASSDDATKRLAMVVSQLCGEVEKIAKTADSAESAAKHVAQLFRR
jgi:hypothetical protein